MSGRGASQSVYDDSIGSPSSGRGEDENVIMIRMDIKEPLDTIKNILEEQIDGIEEFIFTLQDGEELDGSKNLLDHCVQGEGQVQINIELKIDERGKRLDIVDVLKPSEDDDDEMAGSDSEASGAIPSRYQVKPEPSQTFKRSQADDLRHVNDLAAGIVFPKNKKPRQRKKKPVASKDEGFKRVDSRGRNQANTKTPPYNPFASPEDQVGSTFGGQVQLWQFLLELLTDHRRRDCIQWVGCEGEFKLIDPEKVATLWGERKNKPQMNSEKLRRALRHYYNGDMISKVPGKNFVFKFICDLKFLIGYSAGELNAFVVEAAALAARQKVLFPYEIDSAMNLANLESSDYVD